MEIINETKKAGRRVASRKLVKSVKAMMMKLLAGKGKTKAQKTKVFDTRVGAETTLGVALINAEKASGEANAAQGDVKQVHDAALMAIQALTEQMSRPKTATLPDGRKVSIQ
jgi:hypothetical protein